MLDIVKIVERNITQNNLVIRGEQVLVSLSGGPDSTALLRLLHELSRKLKITLGAVYINHKIRPRAVKKEIEFCEKLCHRLQLDFILVEDDIPLLAKEMKVSVEEAGHLFRRAILNEIAAEEGYDKIALAHHADDIVETILFRLFRGTGPQGLNPIKPLSGSFIRPLYNIRKSEIESYLKKIRQPFLLDRSNLKSNYSRNYIRNKILPVIEKHFGDKYAGSIIQFADILAGENRYLDKVTQWELNKISRMTRGGKIVVDLNKMSTYDDWLKRRLIKKIFDKIGARPGFGSYADVMRVIELAEGKSKAADLEDNIRVVRHQDLMFVHRGKIKIPERELKLKGKNPLPELRSYLKCHNLQKEQAILREQKAGNKINMDFDRISPPVIIRNIRPGDRFVPLGMKGSKKIGDWLTDRKIPRIIRDEIPVIADREGIIWLVGHQLADRVRINKATRKVLAVEYVRKKES